MPDHLHDTPGTVQRRLDLPGLAAWEQLRRNRRNRLIRRIAFWGAAVVAVGLFVPDHWLSRSSVQGPVVHIAIKPSVGPRGAKSVRGAVSADPPRRGFVLTAAEKLCLARVLFHETAGDTFEAQVGAAQVLAQQAQLDDLCKTAEKWGFAASCRVEACPERIESDPERGRFDQAQFVANEVVGGRALLRELIGATRFHRVDAVPDALPPALVPHRQIGRIAFFAPPGVRADTALADSVRRNWDEGHAAELIAPTPAERAAAIAAAAIAKPAEPPAAVQPKPTPVVKSVASTFSGAELFTRIDAH